MNIREYVKRNSITLAITEGPYLNRDDDGWEHYRYTVALTWNDGALSRKWRGIEWRQGTGIQGQPDAATVLDSLASDAATYLDSADFEDWAASLGYDTDSRKAETIYRKCGDAAKRLTKFLGGSEAELNRVLYDIERL